MTGEESPEEALQKSEVPFAVVNRDAAIAVATQPPRGDL